MIIGVLSLQGGYAKHAESMIALGADTRYVRSREELEQVDGLILPGGESTTIGKLLDRFEMLTPLKDKLANGFPVYGTCAGMILLAKDIKGYSQFKLDALDISVERNAYGRQIESFEAEIPSSFTDTPVRGVFIRAPRITNIGKEVEVLASFEDVPVLVREGNVLAGSFHPELTDDKRIHQYFLEMVKNRADV